MDYKGYHIIAQLNVIEGWDFSEDPQGSIHLTNFLYRGEAHSLCVTNFTINDPDGSELDEYPETLLEAKEIIDTLVNNTAGKDGSDGNV